MPLDPRLNAFRPDLADLTLRDAIKADKYVEPMLRQCLRGVVPMLESPDLDARQTSQVRYGEFMDVFEMREDGFIWAQNRSDRYVGYVPIGDALGDSIAMLSNRVTALRTFIYPEPDVKAPPVDELTLGSFVSIIGKTDMFVELTNGGYVFAKHVMASEFADTPDYVFTAGRMLHTPYLWGGRTPRGIDCSGLVQLALEMAGIDVPRDSDQQFEALGKPLDTHWRDRAWQRGDIVFFRGSQLICNHVGIMTGTDHMINANGDSMDVTVEPLADIVRRYDEIIGVADAEDVRRLGRQ
jgi:cell wall-associated NlpC family hydrolase